jgi:DNA-binding phage protein
MEQTTKLNSMQLFMIRLFEKQLNTRQQEEIKTLLTDYFATQIDEEMDRIWEEKGLSQEDLDKALEEHKRTHY